VANPTSPQNSNNLDLDLLILSGGLTGYLKRAVEGSNITPSGSPYQAAAELVGLIGAATSAWSSVAAGTAANTTVLAANTARLGATITNNGTAIMYINLGTAAASNRFTATLAPLASGIASYYEVPFRYTGVITGSWSAANGSAYVVELTI